VAGVCECGNEPSGSVKFGEFFSWELSASQEGLCSMRLVKYLPVNDKTLKVRCTGKKEA